MQKITTFLTFNDQAEAAANLDVSVFKNSKIPKTLRCGDAGPGPKDSVLTIEFQLEGQAYVALNGGPHFTFTDGVSLSVDCNTQEEIDRISDGLIAGGGQQRPCGWLTDRFGLSWQVNPRILVEMLGDPDPKKAQRVMAAMMQMMRINIAAIQRAYDQG